MDPVVYEWEPFSATRDEFEYLQRMLGGKVERTGGSKVRIKGMAGHLIMPDGTILAIRSRKAGLACLLSWIAFADPRLASVKLLNTLPAHADDGDVASLMARIFILETWRAVESSGLLRSYRREPVRSAFVRGRIDFARIARSGGDMSRIPCIVFSRLPQTPLNCLISAALHTVRRDPLMRRGAGSLLPSLLAAFAEVPPRVDVELMNGRRPLSRIEAPFQCALTLAILIVRGAGIVSGTRTTGLSFLIDLASLYERAVARAFRESRYAVEVSYPVPYMRESLHTGRREPATPMALDLFIPNLGGRPVVLDAKYKRAISASNLQQMVTYCWLTGARHAFLVVPAGQVADRRRHVFPAGGHGDSIAIDIVGFDIEERTLAGWRACARELVQDVESRVSVAAPSRTRVPGVASAMRAP